MHGNSLVYQPVIVYYFCLPFTRAFHTDKYHRLWTGHTYIHAHNNYTHAHIHMYTHIHIHTHSHAHKLLYTHAPPHMHVHTLTYAHERHTHIHMHMCYTRTNAHTYIHTVWASCPLLCSIKGTWGCCWAAAWGKGWPRPHWCGNLINFNIHCYEQGNHYTLYWSICTSCRRSLWEGRYLCWWLFTFINVHT